MTRTQAKPIPQPNEFTCGPASLKMALEIIGLNRSVPTLTKLCKTTFNGTTINNLARAVTKCGGSALVLENANLRHVKHCLKSSSSTPISMIVNFISRQTQNKILHEDSGHYAVISSYSAIEDRIYLLDPYTVQKISYAWDNFLKRWYDVDFKRTASGSVRKTIYDRPLIILTKNSDDLPKFNLKKQRVYQ